MPSTGHTYPHQRIPNIKYRDRHGNPVTPVQAFHTPDGLPTSERRSIATPPSPSPPAYMFPPASEASPKEGKKKGVLGFFAMKEPSSLALQELSQQQRKEESVKSTRAVVGVPQPSDRKMPAHVPKVNSKWDGLPTHHQRQKNSKDSWKGSIDLPSPLSRASKKLGEQSKRTTSPGRSSETSLRRSNSVEDSPRTPVTGTPSPTSRSVARPVKFERSVSYETSDEPVRNMVRKSVSMSTLDTPSLTEGAFSLDGQQRHPSEPTRGFAIPLREAKLDGTTSLSSPAKSTPPSSPIKTSPPVSLFPRTDSNHSLAQPDRTPIQSIPEKYALQAAPELGSEPESWPLPQWPLSSESKDVPVNSSGPDFLRPRVPIKAQKRLAGQNLFRTIVDSSHSRGTEPPVSSNTPAKTIYDDSREYRPAPGSRVGPISPPISPDSKKVSKSPSTPTTPPSPPIVRTDLRPPVALPGRTLTKDSDLATIAERSETSSIRTVRPTSQADISSMSGNDFDDESIAESTLSKLSAQWFKSPQERLGLGSSMKRTGNDFSWPLPGEDDGRYNVDGEGNRTPTRSSDRGPNGRAGLMGIFKK